MKNFNNEKTEEMLKGLEDENVRVTVENIDKILQENGVLVKVHVGRTRNYVEVSPKVFGIDVDKSEGLNEFFKEYMKNGRMTFIPNTDEKILHNIESKVRTEQKRKAIGYDNEYMTILIYKEFNEYVKIAREEYFNASERILDKWDELILRFKESLKSSLDEMSAINKLNVYEQVIAKLPSREDYRKSFYLDISLRAFPVSENINLFDESIGEEIKQSQIRDSVNSVHEILSNTLADCFDVLNNLLVSFDGSKNGKIAPKTMSGLREGAKRVKQKNLFKNSLIDSISEDMDVMYNMDNGEDIAEMAEVTLAKIYGYAKEVDLSKAINLNKSFMSEEELGLMYNAYKSEFKEA